MQQLTAELDSQVSSGRSANEQLQKLKGEASVLQLWQQNVQAERATEAEAVRAAKQVGLSYCTGDFCVHLYCAEDFWVSHFVPKAPHVTSQCLHGVEAEFTAKPQVYTQNEAAGVLAAGFWQLGFGSWGLAETFASQSGYMPGSE